MVKICVDVDVPDTVGFKLPYGPERYWKPFRLLELFLSLNFVMAVSTTTQPFAGHHFLCGSQNAKGDFLCGSIIFIFEASAQS